MDLGPESLRPPEFVESLLLHGNEDLRELLLDLFGNIGQFTLYLLFRLVFGS